MSNNTNKTVSFISRQKNLIIALVIIFAILLVGYFTVIAPLMKDEAAPSTGNETVEVLPGEVLLGNRIEYEGKAADVALFEKISEVKITVGQKVNHYNYYFLLGKGEISLIRANTNLYLKRIISNYWGGGRFYTNENMVTLINFIGTLLNPNFTLLPEGYRPIEDHVSMDAYTFFGKVVADPGR